MPLQNAAGWSQLSKKLLGICADSFMSPAPVVVELPYLGNVTLDSPCKSADGTKFILGEKAAAVLSGVANQSFTAFAYDGKTPVTLDLNGIFSTMSTKTRLSANAGEWKTFLHDFTALTSDNETIVTYATIKFLDGACGKSPEHQDGAPTTLPGEFSMANLNWYYYGYCVTNVFARKVSAVDAIGDLDYANRYTVAQAYRSFKDIVQRWGPLNSYMSWVVMGKMLWPAEPTPCNYGWRGNINALIVGNLYDGATPFAGSKMMRLGFSSGALITWQGIGHWYVLHRYMRTCTSHTNNLARIHTHTRLAVCPVTRCGWRGASVQPLNRRLR